jgi:hypothetical protein
MEMLEYNETEIKDGKTQYQLDKEYVEEGEALRTRIKGSYDEGKTLSMEDEDIKSFRSKDPKFKSGGWGLEEHVNDYNTKQ